MSLKIINFYHFTQFPDYVSFKAPLQQFCRAEGLKGTILLAPEGINVGLAGSPTAIQNFLDYLRQDPRFAAINPKVSYGPTDVFYRMKVKLKKEIVSLGKPDINPADKTGELVDPEQWNALIQDPDVLTIDVRNDYEVTLGTFKGAVNPRTETFREFVDYVRDQLKDAHHKKIALFCTGGIRCEKASAFMLDEGFEQVYQLNGGILKYLENVPTNDSQWLGECFIFDNRVAVTHGLKKGNYLACPSCRSSVSEAEQGSPLYEAGVACPHCALTLSEQKLASSRERHRQILLAAARQTTHMGSEFKATVNGQP